MAERVHQEIKVYRQRTEQEIAEMPVKQVGETAVSAAASEEILDKIDEAVEEENVIIEDMERLMAEIDLLLEPNAQEFVESFVQKGGQ